MEVGLELARTQTEPLIRIALLIVGLDGDVVVVGVDVLLVSYLSEVPIHRGVH